MLWGLSWKRGAIHGGGALLEVEELLEEDEDECLRPRRCMRRTTGFSDDEWRRTGFLHGLTGLRHGFLTEDEDELLFRRRWRFLKRQGFSEDEDGQRGGQGGS